VLVTDDASYESGCAASGSLARRVTDALSAAAKDVAAKNPGCEANGTVSWIYLGEDWVNAERCAMCGQWGSDVETPDDVACIGLGHWIDGEFFCTQCRMPELLR